MLVSAPVITEIAEGFVSLILASAVVQGVSQTALSLIREHIFRRGPVNLDLINSDELERLKIASASIKDVEAIISRLISENESLRGEISQWESAKSIGK